MMATSCGFESHLRHHKKSTLFECFFCATKVGKNLDFSHRFAHARKAVVQRRRKIVACRPTVYLLPPLVIIGLERRVAAKRQNASESSIFLSRRDSTHRVRSESHLIRHKRGFSCVFGKNRANIDIIRLSDGRPAVRKPDFLISGRKNGEKCRCTFAFLSSTKNSKKIQGGWIWTFSQRKLSKNLAFNKSG